MIFAKPFYWNICMRLLKCYFFFLFFFLAWFHIVVIYHHNQTFIHTLMHIIHTFYQTQDDLNYIQIIFIYCTFIAWTFQWNEKKITLLTYARMKWNETWREQTNRSEKRKKKKTNEIQKKPNDVQTKWFHIPLTSTKYRSLRNYTQTLIT